MADNIQVQKGELIEFDRWFGKLKIPYSHFSVYTETDVEGNSIQNLVGDRY